MAVADPAALDADEARLFPPHPVMLAPLRHHPLHFAAYSGSALRYVCATEGGPFTTDREVFDRAGLGRCPECMKAVSA
jgi:hypothetical protein